jgi:hypothetical protein
VNAAKDNKVYKRKLLQKIHTKIKIMQKMRSKREQNPGNFLSLVNVAATEDTPRKTLLVCTHHRQEMSQPYVADKPDALPHRFCYR